MKTEPASLLVVEDHPQTGELLAVWLRDKGHTVTVCGDGKRALELVEAGRFDLVLLDVGVPGLDGFEVLRRLRARLAAAALPVVMATAHGQSELVIRALELGANDYVTKPYDLPVLLARVNTHLSLKRMVEQRAQLERNLAERNAELERVNLRLSEANDRMRDDLQAAVRVQEALLPARSALIPGVRIAWVFRPCAELAGDTLNVFTLDHDHVGLYLLDVCGHGVPAALLSVHLSLILSPARDSSSVLLRADGDAPPRAVPPAEVVGSLNRRFTLVGTERFFTLFYGVLNRHTGEFRYACAGHPGPAHVSAAGCRILPPSGPPIGLADTCYDEHRLVLGPGDRLYLYSDGVIEAGTAGNLYGKARLADLVLRQRSAPLEDSLAALLAEAEAHNGGPAADDVSVLAVEFTGAAR
jgi:sigma-B regulation protein RsbU (phosphoserine phosphatase)